MKRWIAAILTGGIFAAGLLLLSSCAQSESQRLLDFFKKREEAEWNRRIAEDDSTLSWYVKENGGYGAEIHYALYRSGKDDRYVFLREDAPDGPRWQSYIQTSDTAEWESFYGRQRPVSLDHAQLAGEFSVTLEPPDQRISRAEETNTVLLDQIHAILKERFIDCENAECRQPVAYVNTAEYYAIVIADARLDELSPLQDSTLRYPVFFCEFEYEDDEITMPHDVTEYFGEYRSRSVDEWFFDLARTDAVLKIS